MEIWDREDDADDRSSIPFNASADEMVCLSSAVDFQSLEAISNGISMWGSATVESMRNLINGTLSDRVSVKKLIDDCIFIICAVKRITLQSLVLASDLDVGDIMLDVVVEAISLIRYEDKINSDIIEKRKLLSYLE